MFPRLVHRCLRLEISNPPLSSCCRTGALAGAAVIVTSLRSPSRQSAFTASRCKPRLLSNLKHLISGSSAPFASLDRVAAKVPVAAETGTLTTMTKTLGQKTLHLFRCEAAKPSSQATAGGLGSSRRGGTPTWHASGTVWHGSERGAAIICHLMPHEVLGAASTRSMHLTNVFTF